jgi:membrane protein
MAKDSSSGRSSSKDVDLRDRPRDPKDIPGVDADKPTEIPARGWKEIVKRAWAESKQDQVPLLSAGVAFFGFLSLFPAIIASVLLYGLITTPEEMRSQFESVSSVIPESARAPIMEQLTNLTSAPSRGLGIGLVVSILAALWSASGGVGNLISAINLAYDEDETRGFIKRKGLSLLMTIGAILFFGVALGALAVIPAVLAATDPPTWVTVVAQIVRGWRCCSRWSSRSRSSTGMRLTGTNPRFSWTSIGAGVATVLWIIASVGFSLYASMGSYGKTYGSLAGVVVLLLWLWLTTYAILFGAEINAEAEQQTMKDTTEGPEKPLGERDAVKADSLPDERPRAANPS